MEIIQLRKLIIWMGLTLNLIFSFYIGVLFSSSLPELIITLPALIGIIFILIYLLDLNNNSIIIRKKLLIWGLLSVNLLFTFIIGATIPTLVSNSRENFGYVMIPLLIILNYIILDRYYYYQKHSRKGK